MSARARSHDSVLVSVLDEAESWPGADICLRAGHGEWVGVGAGYGRLRQRRLTVHATGRGPAARPRAATLLLPAAHGGVELEPSVVRLPMKAG